MKNLSHPVILVLLSLAAAMTLSGCHASRESSRWEDPIYARDEPNKPGKQSKNEGKGHYSRPDVKTGKLQKQVIDVACSWIGTPYRYGGNTRKGVDCSGLVCAAFMDGAGILLPRSSREQAEFSKEISFEKAKPGDLIFFVSKRGGSRINHVAIYLGDNRVIHATSSRGVIISSLEDEYWNSHFYCCGRVID